MNGNLATRQNGYSGPSTIKATLTVPNACATIPVKRNIWVGSPNLIKTVNGVVTGTTPVSAGGSYNLASSSTSPGTNFNYNNYAGSGNMTIDLYTPNNPTTQMYVYSNSTDGLRQVKVTATNTCGNYAEDFVFYLEFGNYKAYPNPAKEKITIEFANPASLASVQAKLELYAENSLKPVRSIAVKEVFDDMALKGGNRIELDVCTLPRGKYFLHFSRMENEGWITDKLQFILE
ncbi:MAG: hypothetical protein J7619_19545 [Dyadobacter sp.]|uniref:hypothetical protein n=1 Tax=Dyadobacter sp. TaxID=1914288 RepID=UPI001B187619|nr:hypothetical protein [Dyadobacter sp.]MBO9614907.1 hypothetical protein [Dyadobacter sp.]